MRPHSFIGQGLKFLEVVAVVDELAVLEAVATVLVRLARSRVFVERHHATLAHLPFHTTIVLLRQFFDSVPIARGDLFAVLLAEELHHIGRLELGVDFEHVIHLVLRNLEHLVS